MREGLRYREWTVVRKHTTVLPQAPAYLLHVRSANRTHSEQAAQEIPSRHVTTTGSSVLKNPTLPLKKATARHQYILDTHWIEMP